MANIGYRTANNAASGDRMSVNLGNIASAASVPETLIFAGRLLTTTADGEIMNSPGFDPLDWYITGGHVAGANKFQFFDGTPDALDGPSIDTLNGVDIIHSIRRLTSAAAKWSIASWSGSAWSATTHTTSAKTFTSRTYPSSGVIEFGGSTAPIDARFALVARCNVALTDAQINTCTTDLASWVALPNLTNLWRFDGASIVDLVGTATQNTLTGTSVTANGFPLADTAASAPVGHAYEFTKAITRAAAR